MSTRLSHSIGGQTAALAALVDLLIEKKLISAHEAIHCFEKCADSVPGTASGAAQAGPARMLPHFAMTSQLIFHNTGDNVDGADAYSGLATRT